MSESGERTEAQREAERRARESARSERDRISPPPTPRPAGQPNRLQVMGSRPRTRRPDVGPRRALAVVVAGSSVVVIAIVAWFLIALFQPFTGSGHGSVEVSIPPEQSTAQVGRLLAKDGVVSSGFFFRLRVELGGDHLRSGTYRLKYGMSYGAALEVLTTAPGAPPTTNVTIIPGKSRYQLDRLLASQGVAGSYLAQTRKSALLNPVTYGAPRGTPTLEGFLYPDTYNLRRPIGLAALVTDQLTQFKREFATVNFSYAKSKNLTPYDVLIIASLEDAEAALPGDLPKVASVIYNRLALGMDLGLDTTAAYAANNYSGNLTAAQLNSSSPWNTLNRTGLPPTPIDSPDITAIEAAAHPGHTDFTYFIVKVCGDGALNFTDNYAQFEVWSQEYNASLAQRGAQKTEFCAKRS